jgi:hypothetical protein
MLTRVSFLSVLILAVLALIGTPVIASELTVPNSFSNGTAADADEVNSNFAAAKSAVDDNYARLPLVWASRDEDTAPIQPVPSIEPIEMNTLSVNVPTDGVVTISGSLSVYYQNSSGFYLVPYIDGSSVTGTSYMALSYNQQNQWNTLSYTVTLPIASGSHTISQVGTSVSTPTNLLVMWNNLTVTFFPTAQSSYSAANP